MHRILTQREIDWYISQANSFRSHGDDLLADMCMQTVERLTPKEVPNILRIAELILSSNPTEVHAMRVLHGQGYTPSEIVVDGIRFTLEDQYYDGTQYIYKYYSVRT